MVYVEIKKGYNSVFVHGDSEKITVSLIKSRTEVRRIVIHRYPNLFERIFPACYEERLFLINPTEEKFKARIKKAIEITRLDAYRRDALDEAESTLRCKKQHDEDQKHMSVNQFVESFQELQPKSPTTEEP